MNDRILLVDDDFSLLNTLKRNLAFDFEVSTAESGPEALALIKGSEPFSVIMVDMRMPGMEGIEVIQKARTLTPNSVFLMLTGNQDVATAMNAVNEGQVFRFLNKPCQMGDIKTAIEAGIKQHDLIISKEELLKKTFAGAIGVLVEIIEYIDDPLVDTDDIQAFTKSVLPSPTLSADWRVPLTSRLMVAGVPLLSLEHRETLQEAEVSSEDHRLVVNEIFAISNQLIKQIPRLEPVAELLARMAEINTPEAVCEGDTDQIGQAILLGYYQSLLKRRGDQKPLVVAKLNDLFPNAIEDFSEHVNCKDEVLVEGSVEQIPVSELSFGMTVAENVRAPNGLLLIAAGRKLSPPMVTRLQQIGSLEYVSVRVEQAEPELAAT